MNFLLKIVEGPNKGAEAALVEGVAVTLGKGDDCDIVLADPTMPDEPVKIEVSGSGVSAGGAELKPFHVMTSGATSFAVGPADAPWGELVWPKAAEEAAESGAPEGGEAAEEKKSEEPAEPSAPAPAPEEPPAETGKKRRGCGAGCLAALILAALALVAIGWLFRGRAASTWTKISGGDSSSQTVGQTAAPDFGPAALASIAGRYGLELSGDGGATRLSGNLRTRRERLAATAEAYGAMPGVDLDLSDDESLRSAAEDALFTLSEGALKVAAATNRVLVMTGASTSPFSLKAIVEALNADIPKLEGVDVSGVVFGAVSVAGGAEPAQPAEAVRASAPAGSARAKLPALPVCGILTTPYPCLVMRDGRRVMEGSAIGDGVVFRIEADEVTITNSTGRFTWRP